MASFFCQRLARCIFRQRRHKRRCICFRFLIDPHRAFSLLLLLCMAAVAWTEHSAPLSLRAQHSEDPAQNPHQQDKPCPDELHRFPLTLVQCTQNKKQPCKENSFRCAPDEPFALLQNGNQQTAEKAADRLPPWPAEQRLPASGPV